MGAQQVQGGGVVVDGEAGGIGQGGRMGQIAEMLKQEQAAALEERP